MSELFASCVPNVISIGSDCRPRFQIERHLKALWPTRGYPSFFWDWLFMGGAEGVIWCLENDFCLAEEDFYAYHCEPTGQYFFRHRPSGFAFLHDFGGEYESLEKAAQGFEREKDQTIAKFRFLAARTRVLLRADLPIVCLYSGELSEAHAIRIGKLLGSGKGQRFLVNVLQADHGDCRLAPEIASTHFVQDASASKPPSQIWQGCDVSWDQVLSSLPVKPGYYPCAD